MKKTVSKASSSKKASKAPVRTAGVLLPVFSLPSPYGIGSFGREAYRFVDFLVSAGQSYWQILPLGPTGYGDSPYQSFSTFAGNPYYIDIDTLIVKGLITKADAKRYDFGRNASEIDYEKIYNNRFKLLKKAYKSACDPKRRIITGPAYRSFVKKNSDWLGDYALFMAIKDSLGGVSYTLWPDDIRLRKPAALARYRKELSGEVGFYFFLQFLFYEQWTALKSYANKKGIKIIGDIPIYVSPDGADIWAHPELFRMDAKGFPTEVAGCPPDFFAKTGQLWGNPIYDWAYHKRTGYAWWMKRLSSCFALYDVVRIDHFRGFDEYWAIPYGAGNAIGGKWKKGPGYALFDTMKKTLGDRPVIAEDLGFITDSVRELVKRTGYPNMKIIEFGFEAFKPNEHIPFNYAPNSVVYTGTHDNDTLLAWCEGLSDKDKKYAMDYFRVSSVDELPAEFLRAALSSAANTCIIPLQDYLGLGNEARINRPSTIGGNWVWRYLPSDLTADLAKDIKALSRLYGRSV